MHDPLPLEGLYLGGCGCHGGPGITFVPGYNAAHAALDDRAAALGEPANESA